MTGVILIQVISKRDRSILRDLAKHVKELSESPVMMERIKAWTRNNDLQPSRTMVLLELGGLGPEMDLLYEAFPDAGDFMAYRCEGNHARELEKSLKMKCLEHMTICDDSVINAYYDISWAVETGNYGVEIKSERGIDSGGRKLGFQIIPPIKDICKAMDVLKPRVFFCDKEGSLEKKAAAEEVFGDILYVRMRKQYWWTMGLTWDLINLIGMENMMVGMVEEPDAIHAIMRFLCDDSLRFARFLEEEGLFCPNSENDYIGSGSRGFTDSLPRMGKRPDGGAHLKDCWVLLESQETVLVSPDMFTEFVLPYQKKIAEAFGLVYYGCCEPLDKRIKSVLEIPNIRSLSVSPWCDEMIMAGACAGKHVYSRKPAPSILSGPAVDYDATGRDIINTLKTAEGCNLEIIMKDLHTTCGDIMRVKKWVDQARSLAGTVGL